MWPFCFRYETHHTVVSEAGHGRVKRGGAERGGAGWGAADCGRVGRDGTRRDGTKWDGAGRGGMRRGGAERDAIGRASGEAVYGRAPRVAILYFPPQRGLAVSLAFWPPLCCLFSIFCCLFSMFFCPFLLLLLFFPLHVFFFFNLFFVSLFFSLLRHFFLAVFLSHFVAVLLLVFLHSAVLLLLCQFCLLVLSNLAVVPGVRLALRLGAATGAAPAVVLALTGAASAAYHVCDLEVRAGVATRQRGGRGAGGRGKGRRAAVSLPLPPPLVDYLVCMLLSIFCCRTLRTHHLLCGDTHPSGHTIARLQRQQQ